MPGIAFEFVNRGTMSKSEWLTPTGHVPRGFPKAYGALQAAFRLFWRIVVDLPKKLTQVPGQRAPLASDFPQSSYDE